MFRPCILAIVRLYNKLNKPSSYTVCACVNLGGGKRDLVLQYRAAWPWTTMDRF
jgi:hypothetical protein